jgi:hypothetical protein
MYSRGGATRDAWEDELGHERAGSGRLRDRTRTPPSRPPVLAALLPLTAQHLAPAMTKGKEPAGSAEGNMIFKVRPL